MTRVLVLYSLYIMMKTSSAFVTLALTAAAYARTFTVYNGCPFTVW